MRIGDVTLARVRGAADLRHLLPDDILDSETLIVKPNWFSWHPGNFTDSETLRFLLEVLDTRVVIIEGYTLERQDGSMKFTTTISGWLKQTNTASYQSFIPHTSA